MEFDTEDQVLLLYGLEWSWMVMYDKFNPLPFLNPKVFLTCYCLAVPCIDVKDKNDADYSHMCYNLFR